jgi:acyl-CoA dehydrogenase
MDFSISEESRLLTASLRRFVEEELQPLEGAVETKGELAPGKAREIFLKSRDLGFYAMNMPEEVGGGGLGAVEMCLAAHEMGRTSDILVRRAFGTVYELLLACTGSQRDEWLLPAVRGDRTCAIAMTEPGAGSDAAGIKTSAKRDGCGWVLNGGKHFVSDGVFSDFFAVTARTDPDKGARGISVFLVDKNASGVTVRQHSGWLGDKVCEIAFDNVQVPASGVVGDVGGAWGAVEKSIDRATSVLSAYMAGGAQRAYEMCRDYSTERIAFGVPIGTFQRVQDHIIVSLTEAEASKWTAYEALWRLDSGRADATVGISMAKAVASDGFNKACDASHNVHAGVGVDLDLGLTHYTARARTFQHYLGDATYHRRRMAELMELG